MNRPHAKEEDLGGAVIEHQKFSKPACAAGGGGLVACTWRAITRWSGFVSTPSESGGLALEEDSVRLQPSKSAVERELI